MSSQCRFAKSLDAKEAGWVSRRHKSVTSREEAIEANKTKMAKMPPHINPIPLHVGKKQLARLAKKK